MRSPRSSLILVVALSVWFLTIPSPASLAAETNGEDAPGIPVERWLVLGPVGVTPPAFEDEAEERGVAALLDEFALGDDAHPAQLDREVVAWDGSTVRWTSATTRDDAVALGSGGEGDAPAIATLVAYVRVNGFTEAELRIEGEHPFHASLGGDALGAGKSHPLDLTEGLHALEITTVRDPSSDEPWTIGAELVPADDGSNDELSERVAFDLDPRRDLQLDDLLDATRSDRLRLSHDGSVLAMRQRHPAVPADDRRTWVEFVDTRSGETLRSTTHDLGSLEWSPVAREYAWIDREDGAGTLWVASFDRGAARAVLEDVKDLGGFAWTPDGGAIVYSIVERFEPDEDEKTTGHRRVRSMPDRWPTFRNVTHLWSVDLETGNRRRLTAATEDLTLLDVRPDGGALLLSRAKHSETEWPFLETELWELDLEALKPRKVATLMWSGTAEYAPDGARALVLAGPSAFGQEGVAEDVEGIPNEYDTQAYVLDLASGDATPITRAFAPKIEEGAWPRSEDAIYLRAQDGSHIRLYRYDVTSQRFDEVPSDVDAVLEMDLAAGGATLAYRGSSAGSPGGVFVRPADTSPDTALVRAALDDETNLVRIGRVEDFDFTKDDGTTIVGRVHYPPAFDSSKTYPAIVYYYAGTNPVSRTFGGRYPKNLWAAHGYVVYVLQPSGATGFGQEFAARHVNDWGKTTVDEIIEGTKAFVEAHPFVDPERVGCIGASYGGFMTQLLVSHTNIFAGAVSHAGISSLSSYWGEGYWGYIYSAIATAKSYPWNRRDIYVDQSALFRADRIDTPLLLLHGSVDTNVPPGESTQLFAALKILGKDVELVSVGGEDHLILDYPKRKRWMQTILAWFDRTLVGDSAWWNALYRDSDEEGQRTR
jgi:dipeptidyl aminopeptidase/acylaminoacyl peptidase